MIRRREFVAMALAKPQYRIIDPHVHVWKADPKYPWAKETKNPPKEDASAEMLLDLMKANNVERTVLVQVIHYRWDNSYTAGVLKKYPKEFVGVARVNPDDPAAPDHLTKLVREQHFQGVRLSPSAGAAGDWIHGDLMPPLWKRCHDEKAVMQILAPVSRMPDIGALCEKFPGLTVVIDHMADCPIDQPQELEKLIALKRYPKVFVKISHTWSISKQPYPFLDAQEYAKRLRDAYGAQRVMWGTDWPIVNQHCGYAKALTVVKDEMKFLSDEDKKWILGGTVEKVFKFR